MKRYEILGGLLLALAMATYLPQFTAAVHQRLFKAGCEKRGGHVAEPLPMMICILDNK